ncbi:MULTISPECIES: CHASE2 domain-containing protein [Aerosakkonema]|uniref:CHASE2 domain-containing protein n=1 Tax=Aerosakkonema TaxID=1246629 RepID=UPI0035B9F491
MWSKLKRQIWEWRGVFITAPSVAGLIILLRFAGLLQLLEWSAYDRFIGLRPQEQPDDRIVIVGITETDLKTLKQWPIHDDVLAKLLNKIKQQRPIAIGLDIYRDLPVEPGNKELVQVYNSTPNLIGIKKMVGGSSGPAVDPPQALQAKNQIGANDIPLDTDSKIRRHFLYISKRDETIESLALRLALIYLERKGIKPQGAALNPANLQLGQTVFVPFEANDGGYVSADARGYQILLNFRGPADTFKSVSLMDVLENRIPSDLMRDRIVMIGSTADSLNDLLYTPYSSSIIGIPKRTSGVEVHANLTSAILSAALEGRPLIKSWPEWLEWLWIFAAASVGAILSWIRRYKGGVAKFSIRRTASMLLAVGSIVSIAYLAFLRGWWIPVVPPVLAFAGSTIAITGYIARTAGEIRNTFSRYLTDEVVASLLESPEGLKLGGERRKITILMSDLRGFSAVSERLPPETVVSMLNIYLGDMADVIVKYQGTIDEFIGDAILILFGAPTQREDDAERAVACAIAMQLAMDTVNQKNDRLGLPKIEMGIGINTGEVVVGNIGSSKRAKYGVVGSHVNLTARIESYTLGGEILISEDTLKDIGDILQVDGDFPAQPKGFNEPITIYEVGGIGGKYNLKLPKQEDLLIKLKDELPVQYGVLKDKHLDGSTSKGSLVKLSTKGAELRSDIMLKAREDNIKMSFLIGSDRTTIVGDIYGKVLRKIRYEENNYYIVFTNISPEAKAIINQIYNSYGNAN